MSSTVLCGAMLALGALLADAAVRNAHAARRDGDRDAAIPGWLALLALLALAAASLGAAIRDPDLVAAIFG